MASVILDRITHSTKWGARLIPLLYYYITNPWRSIRRIPKVSKPVLFYSGLKDKLIPPAHMQTLFEAATAAENRWMHTVPDGDHNNTVDKGGRRYYERFRVFMKAVITK